MGREGFVTTAEARELGFYHSYLYRRRAGGKLKAYKFEDDKKTYWSIEELNQLRNPRDLPVVRQPR